MPPIAVVRAGNPAGPNTGGLDAHTDRRRRGFVGLTIAEALPRAITNLYGGGISIGHPPGATGLRMTMTAMHHLADTKGRYAIVSMCLGSGMGMATLVENLDR